MTTTQPETASRTEQAEFTFATAEHTLVAKAAERTITDLDPFRLADRTISALSGKRGASPQLALGVLPFDTGPATSTPSHVVLPSELRTERPTHRGLPRGEFGQPLWLRPVPSPDEHKAAVAGAVGELDRRGLRKVVLARALDLQFAEPVNAQLLLRNLLQDNANGYAFQVKLPRGAILVGASPELLLSRRGRRVLTHPHAGSAPRSADPVIDRANAEALMASSKDHFEHRVLVESIVETLRPFCRSLTVPERPTLVSTAAMWHLGSRISGELKDKDITALQLAAAVHPTPAICGSPTAPARTLIGELETFDRGYYGGAVGWMDADGDGEWAVAIRCAELTGCRARLYAGGGIVAGSDPRAELDETTAKFQTLLRAIGVQL